MLPHFHAPPIFFILFRIVPESEDDERHKLDLVPHECSCRGRGECMRVNWRMSKAWKGMNDEEKDLLEGLVGNVEMRKVVRGREGRKWRGGARGKGRKKEERGVYHLFLCYVLVQIGLLLMYLFVTSLHIDIWEGTHEENGKQTNPRLKTNHRLKNKYSIGTDTTNTAGRGGRGPRGAARCSTASIKCLVEAEHVEDVTWSCIRKRVDGMVEELPSEDVRVDGSSIIVTPNTPEDYGHFLYRAANSVGLQREASVVSGDPGAYGAARQAHKLPRVPSRRWWGTNAALTPRGL